MDFTAALDLGIATPTITKQYLLDLSAIKDEEWQLKKFTGPDLKYEGDREEFIEAIQACIQICFMPKVCHDEASF